MSQRPSNSLRPVAPIVVSGRRPEPLDSLVERIVAAGGVASSEPLDVADKHAVSAVVQRILDAHTARSTSACSAPASMSRTGTGRC